MFVRIEAYDVMGSWRVRAIVLDQDGPDGPWEPALDRMADVPRLDSTDTPEDVLASIASECNNLAYRRS